ncbi:MAG: mono/diheme cytochrome c family protein, partial [Myxococcota bacterium]
MTLFRNRSGGRLATTLVTLTLLGCAQDDEAPATVDPVERGRYLVEVVADCGRCHTPLNADGTLYETRHLAGRLCYI